jgi:hypothetical protein
MDHFEQKCAELLQISLSNPDPYRNIYKKFKGISEKDFNIL